MANLQSTSIAGSVTIPKGIGSASGTTVTVDLATGEIFEVDFQNASGDISTFTINNIPSGVTKFILRITQGSTARQFNWLALPGFKWADNSRGAQITTSNDEVDIIILNKNSIIGLLY